MVTATLGFTLKEAELIYVREHLCIANLTGDRYFCQVGPRVVESSDMASVAWSYRLAKKPN